MTGLPGKLEGAGAGFSFSLLFFCYHFCSFVCSLSLLSQAIFSLFSPPLSLIFLLLAFFLFLSLVVLVAKPCLTLFRLHGLKPSRFLCPWDFPGKNTGVGCHLFLQGIFPTRDWTCVSCIDRWILYHWATREAPLCMLAKLPQLCLTLCDPVDFAHQAPLSTGILQARILEWRTWLPGPSPGDLPNPRTEPVSLMSTCIGRRTL